MKSAPLHSYAGRRFKISGLFDKLVPTFRAMDIDFPSPPGDANRLTALRAGEIAVIPILQSSKKLQKLLIFLPSTANIAGKHSKNQKPKRDIRKWRKIKFTKHPNYGKENSHEQKHDIQLIRPIAAIHKLRKALFPTLHHELSP